MTNKRANVHASLTLSVVPVATVKEASGATLTADLVSAMTSPSTVTSRLARVSAAETILEDITVKGVVGACIQAFWCLIL